MSCADRRAAWDVSPMTARGDAIERIRTYPNDARRTSGVRSIGCIAPPAATAATDTVAPAGPSIAASSPIPRRLTNSSRNAPAARLNPRTWDMVRICSPRSRFAKALANLFVVAIDMNSIR